MGVVRQLKDGLRNLVANLGTPRDKATGTHYVVPCLTEMDLWAAYRGAWLPRKIVDIPALDACRNWRSWSADAKQISAIEAEEKRLGLQGKLLLALTRARLWGGAAIYIGTGDADPSLPLRPESIKAGGIKHLTVIPKRVLKADEVERNPDSPDYGKPRSYTMSGSTGILTIHPSRLVVLLGAPMPDEELATGHEYGWGDSVLTAIIDQIKQADSTSANVASLVFEAKIDVISIPNLMANLAGDPTYEQQVLERLTLAATAKGINGALILDKEEDYEQKSANFSNLKDLVLAFMQLVSGASDIPMTRLLGQSPAGLGGDGAHETRNYYDRIASMQTLVLDPAMAVLNECLIRSALGSRPSEVFFTWRSLWQTTDKERADIGKVTADTIKVINDTKLIPEEVLAKAAVNMLTESGVAPGLEADMAEWELENPDGDGFEEDDVASVSTTPAGREGEEEDPAAIVDAAPKPLYVRRDVVNVADLQAWAKAQGIPDLADDLHVTVAYSRQAFDWIKAGNAKEWTENGKDELIISEGGPRAVEPLGGMTAVLLFASAQLTWRHSEILRAGASHDWDDYQPHVSLTKSPIDLSKVEPYRGRIVLGPEIFEDLREG
jgi:phage-related protein (TIGR01555 family)